MSKETQAQELLSRLKNYPELMTQVEELVDIVENKQGNLIRFDDVEEKIINFSRKTNSITAKIWSDNRVETVNKEADQQSELRRAGKKNCSGTAV